MARREGAGPLPYAPVIAPNTCHRCGTDTGSDEAVPLGWSTSVPDGGDGAQVQILCPRCTREHVRDIEAKLDEAWWP
ncbi:MAG: hypothetical protein ACSLFO_14520 [Acidimicrobiales bacterium]